VPTTVLAQQHYLTFRDRFHRFPVKVDMLSALSLRRGRPTGRPAPLDGREVDVVIGTHRLLQRM